MDFVLWGAVLLTGLFIAGESYGGKYAPAATAAVIDYNKKFSPRAAGIPLRGMIIGGISRHLHANPFLCPTLSPALGCPLTPPGLSSMCIVTDGWCDPSAHIPAYAPMMVGMGLLDTAQNIQVSEAMARSAPPSAPAARYPRPAARGRLPVLPPPPRATADGWCCAAG